MVLIRPLTSEKNPLGRSPCDERARARARERETEGQQQQRSEEERTDFTDSVVAEDHDDLLSWWSGQFQSSDSIIFLE